MDLKLIDRQRANFESELASHVSTSQKRECKNTGSARSLTKYRPALSEWFVSC